MKYFYQGFIPVLLMILIASCAGTIPEPAQEQIQWASAKWPGTGKKELSEGRELYILKCSGCHSLRQPDSRSENEWRQIMPKMGKKAKLTDSEYEMILRYLSALSGR
ncbi:MAG: hypothetical protein ACM3Q2_01250 [Syntrophothermus sp.]